MALKFRRGTTAQKSGSLAFGEPFINTDLNTLQIGGASGDITLGTTGESSAFAGVSVSASSFISGSGLKITGNAAIDGNLTLGGAITIGDATADTVNVVANLSSSLIPSNDNAFNVGRSDRRYAGVFANYLRANYVDIQAPSGSEVRIKNNLANTEYHLRNTDSGSFEIYNTNGKPILFATSASVGQLVQVIINDELHVNGDINAVDITAGTLTGSLSGSVFGIGNVVTFSTSVDSRLDSVELVSASAASALNSFSASNAVTDATQTTNISTATAAAAGAFASASAYSASAAVVDAAQDVLIASLRTNVVSSSVFTTFSTSVDSRLDSVELVSASAATAYAKVGSANTFNGNQTISGSLFVTQDLVLGGSASIQHVTSSQLNIADNIITVNTINPTVRFGGLAVNDSGSGGISGSLLYDSVQDEWVFVHKGNGTNITSSHVVMGPLTFDNLGNETYLTNNRIPKGSGIEHLNDSNITDTGTLITLGSNTSVTGTLVATGTSLVSASAQIDITSTTGYSTFSSSLATRDAGQDTTISTLSSSVASRLGTLETKDITITLTGDVTGTGTITDLSNVSFATTVAANSVALGTDTTGDYVSSLVAGTNITLSNNTGEGATPTIGLTNNAITIAGTSTSLGGTISAATIGNAIGAVSSSAQVTSSVFGAVSGDVTISSTGVATIAANSVALGTDTTGNYVASLVAGTNITLSNNSGEGATPTIGLTNNTISGISLGSNLATLTIGTGLSGTSYNGSTGVTIANTGVTSNVAGTGVTVSGATGAVTISIGQAVATSDNVRFNSLGIGMAASATAGRIDASNDIVAFSSSDIRFKENITPIENALEKISKISGNTYDWKEENKAEHGYEGNDVGVIAQEIEAVLPQLVQTRENGYKAVKYDKLVALLIEGIKEQQTQIHSLTLEIEKLKESKGL
jgi:hypothetical protein